MSATGDRAAIAVDDETAAVEGQESRPLPEGTLEPWIPPLRYRAQSMVRWFAPTEILRGAYGEFFGRLFGRYADSRETQAALREPVVHHAQGPLVGGRLGRIDPENFLFFCNDQLPFHATAAGTEPLIVDYVADLGDGFSSTFTIARQMAEPTTTVSVDDDIRLDLPRGRLIVMGGDEVYPAAGPEHYRDRTIGPYRTAFPPESSTGSDGSDRRRPPGQHREVVANEHLVLERGEQQDVARHPQAEPRPLGALGAVRVHQPAPDGEVGAEAGEQQQQVGWVVPGVEPRGSPPAGPPGPRAPPRSAAPRRPRRAAAAGSRSGSRSC